MASTRDQIVQTTCDLLELQGYHGTGLNQILRESGAPRGSLYYYFPDGKEGLAVEAIERAGSAVAGRIRAALAGGDDVAAVAAGIQSFVKRIAEGVEASGYRAGGPLTSVAMETATTSPRLNAACREAFAAIQGAFAERLRASGFSDARAADLAAFITSAIEGGILLSRTSHSGDPLRRVAHELGSYLQHAATE